MKYWVYLNGEVPGSYEAAELAGIPGFGETALVCPSTDQLAERRWERAGAFPDIAEALRAVARPPLPPPQPPAVRLEGPARTVTPDEILNDSSQRLFRHVTELMKELENRREERALTQSLQRRVADLSNELTALRERATYLQGRADLIPGFQDRERELQEALARARADLHETRGGAERLDADLGKALTDLQSARRAIEQLKTEAAEREGLLKDASTRLAEKEATLAKAFGVIRRLEESLYGLLPGATAGISREVPEYRALRKAEPAPEPARERSSAPEPEPESVAAPEPEPEPVVVPLVPEPPAADERHYSLDRAPAEEQTPLPPEGEVTPVPPPWQEKLSGLLSSLKKKFGS
ncbi:MAG: hypothetical protein HY928_11250 [Elusimicrobia bacterium]|nr:hypothetical protein [Elusimicrobiota bacterium]